ncbi:HYR domain-containing protein [Prolixibacteraceae bacterium Z1-6]|uniref:HYR domain-containing protein n=1 Tax=Draconibacterium aestuarii TaxID=2998507 RepID=A0A9X3J543_9BACT|nr:HYR domain-containing protein [Prolixibacteraceae bacterium Z1-6]
MSNMDAIPKEFTPDIYCSREGMSDHLEGGISRRSDYNVCNSETGTEQNAGIDFPKSLQVQTDPNSCVAFIDSALQVYDPNNVIVKLTWQMTGATDGNSPEDGVNQIGGYSFNVGVTLLTYTVESNLSETNISTISIEVVDSEAPQIVSAPGDIGVSNDPGECSAHVYWSDPVARDNCLDSEQLVYTSNYKSGEKFPVGETVVRYSITDGKNSTEFSFTVSVKDNEGPVVSAPPVDTSYCGEAVPDAFTSWEQFEQAGGSAYDNCGINYNSFRYFQNKASSISCPYTVTRTYLLEDIYRNVTEFVHVIEVSANGNSGESDVDNFSGINPGSGGNATAAISASINNVTCFGGSDGSITVDTSSVAQKITKIEWDNGSSTLNLSGLSADIYTLEITAGGSVSSQIFAVTEPGILDASVIKKQITCFGADDGKINVSVPTGGSGIYQVSINGIDWYDVSMAMPYEFTELTAGTYSVQLRDAVNLDCFREIAKIAIADPSPLTITTSVTETTCSGTNDGDITVAVTGGTPPFQYSSDGAVFQVSEVLTSLAVGSYMVTVRDSNLCSIEKEVVITQAPPNFRIISQPQAQVDCSGATVEFKVEAINAVGTFRYQWQKKSPNDNDFEDIISANSNALKLDNIGSNDVGLDSTFYRVIISDDCSSAVSDSALLRLNEIIEVKPAQEQLEVCNGETVIYEVVTRGNVILYFWEKSNSTNNWIPISDGGKYSGSGTSELTISDVGASESGVYRVRVVFETINTSTGNKSCNEISREERILVVDNIKPEPKCQNKTVSLGWSSPLVISASDIDNGSTDNCGIATISLSQTNFDCSHLGNNIVTLTVTDTNGNDSTCTATVLVVDNVSPSFTVPGSVTLDAGTSCSPDVTPSKTGMITVMSDNCTADQDLLVTYADGASIAGLCGGEYSITRTWTVSDKLGNSTSKDQLITVVDGTNPVMSIPENVALLYGDPTEPQYTGQASVTDNCDSNPVVSYSDSISYEVGCPYTVFRKWTATDWCGNSSSAFQQIRVSDTEAPILILPNDTAVATPNDIPLVDTSVANAIDNFDTNPTIEFLYEEFTGLDAKPGFCPTSVTRYFRASDQCGNSVVGSYIIYVSDVSDCAECQESVPFFYLDLTYSAEAEETIKNVDRHKAGYCCSEGNSSCVAFNILFHRDVIGLEITVNGATPKGQEWDVDCESVDLNKEYLCIPTDEQFHLFTLCKPGNNLNSYTFRTLIGASVPDDEITTRVECVEQLSISGIADPVWNSVYPGVRGEYNSYLDLSDPYNPVFSAPPGAPGEIRYEVAGPLVEPVCGQTADTALVTILVKEAIAIDLNIEPDLMCEDSPDTIAPVISPVGSYEFEWYVGNDTTGVPFSTAETFVPTAEGEYVLKVTDADHDIPCSSEVYNFEILFDYTGPTIQVPPNTLTVQCNDGSVITSIQNWLNSAQASYTNSRGIFVEFIPENDFDFNNLDMACNDTLEVTFSAFDHCSNMATNTALIVVIDTIAPIIFREAADASTQCTGIDPDQNAAYLGWLANHGGAAANDDCDANLTWITDTDTSLWSGDQVNNQISITFTVFDDCGNTAQTTATFSIFDTIAPAINTLQNIVECPEFVLPAGSTMLNIDPAEVSDDCYATCSFSDYTIRWRIDFADSTSLPAGGGYATGHISDLGVDILFPADSLTFLNADHKISYWIEDCSGNVSEAQIRTVTVLPPPVVVSPADTLYYCYGDTVSEILLTGYPQGDVVFDISGGALLGIANQTGVSSIPAFWATKPGSAIISITPRTDDCIGETVDFVIVVKPVVNVSVSPARQTICSGDSTDIRISSNTAGATFSWEISSVTPSGSVAGASGGAGNYIRQGLVNNTSSPAEVVYRVSVEANGCPGIMPTPVTITVNPVPELLITDPDTICEPETIDLTDIAITAGSSAGADFTYWADTAATVSLANPDAIIQSGTYYIMASFGTGCTTIKPVNVVVNPVPGLTSTLTPDGICSNTPFSYTPSGNLPGTVFTWSRAAIPGISNPAETGTDNIDEILVNETSNPIEVTYIYTLYSPDGCNSVYEVKVMVTQSPYLTSTNPDGICSGEVLSYNPTSNVSGTVFNWTRNADAYGNAAASGTGDPNEILVNQSNGPISVIYYYSLSSNNCSNPTVFQVMVVVTPSPEVTVRASEAEICPGEAIDLFSLSTDLLNSALETELLMDDFHSGTGNWTASGSQYAWSLQADSSVYTSEEVMSWIPFRTKTVQNIFHSNDSTPFLLANHHESVFGLTNTTSYLTSKIFDTKGYTEIKLSFWHHYKRGTSSVEKAVVEYSTDGTNWNMVGTEEYSYTRGEADSFEYVETTDLPVGESTVQIRFAYTTIGIAQKFWWAIDNIQVTGVPQVQREIQWTSTPAGFTSTEGNPTGVYPTETTSYIATYTDPLTNCSGSDTVTVIVRELPDVQIYADYCSDPGYIILTATEGASYLWSTGETTQIIKVDVADIYSVKVIDEYGCENVAYTGVSTELVINGDFEQGNVDFSTGYQYVADDALRNNELNPEGYYSVGTNAQHFHSNFWGSDHTNGSGNYMIVNGWGSDQVVWEQEIDILPNTEFYFSAWAMSLNSVAPFVKLRFEINGVQIGTTANLPVGQNNNRNPWTNRFYGNWNSGNATKATVRIINLEPALGGNDFGLDDISFGTLEPLPSEIEASGLNTTVCEGDSVQLLLDVQKGKEPFTYSWTGPNGYTSNEKEPVIYNTDPAFTGDYIVTVTDGYGCGPIYDTVQIVVNEAAIVDAGSDQLICASENEVSLNGSYGGSTTSVTWSGGTGSFLSAADPTTTYTFSDTDIAAGGVTLVLTSDDPPGVCGPVSDTVNISIYPLVEVVVDTAVHPLCPRDKNGYITVHGEGGVAPYSYFWDSTPKQTSATAGGLRAGTYKVTVTDANGCWDTLSVTLSDPPELVVSDTVQVTEPSCYNGSDGTATVIVTSGNNPTFWWHTEDTTQTITGLSAGVYFVYVMDENACSVKSITLSLGEPAPPAVQCPDDITVLADYGKNYVENLKLAAPDYQNDCPLVDQVWVLSGATSDSSSQTGIDTLKMHDFNIGVTKVTYTFVDEAGNVNECFFLVTVEAAPEIECHEDTTIYIDRAATGCEFIFDPGVPDLVQGVPPITWSWKITYPDGSTNSDIYTKYAPDYSADAIGNMNFPLGVSTIEWKAENGAGFDSCAYFIEIVDTLASGFEVYPFEACVDPIRMATYVPGNETTDPVLLIDPDPDGYTFGAGNTALDITFPKTNCCDSAAIKVYWEIVFADTPGPNGVDLISHDTIRGVGQPSVYIDPKTGSAADIFFWGDGVNYMEVIHEITYWVVDCFGNISTKTTSPLVIKPRPKLVKKVSMQNKTNSVLNDIVIK